MIIKLKYKKEKQYGLNSGQKNKQKLGKQN